MTTKPYPKASLLEIACRRCPEGKAESGGYRIRRHRDLSGIREVKVRRIRCNECKRSLGCVYPEGVQRYKWYSSKVQGIFAILDIHQVDETCSNELAEHLGYPIEAETRTSWQATRAFRAKQIESQDKHSIQEIELVSIDEMKLGYWWLYTLTEVKSQAVVDYALCENRDEEVVRELIANNNPKMIISDGCPSIAAACAYFADKPHGRCWFHVIRDVLRKFSKQERRLVSYDLRFLYSCKHLKDADWFLTVLKERYDPTKLESLLNAWQQLRLYWQHEAMPLTNNSSETLYSAIWARSRKRLVKALDIAANWFIEARFRWHHHLIRGLSPWQRLTDNPAKPWLFNLITPLRYSTDF
jgi:transposase-like protein